MTKDEAAEIVLGGKVYKTCSNCEGRGGVMRTQKVVGKQHRQSRRPTFGLGVAEPCKQCSGAGTETRPEYHQACEVLKIERKFTAPWRPSLLSGEDWFFDEDSQQWVDLNA